MAYNAHLWNSTDFVTPDKLNNMENGIKNLDVNSIKKDDLAKVATSGNYNDLSNKPSINNATLTIKQAGNQKGTFTANASNNVTIELTDNNDNTWRGIQNNLTSTSTTDSLSAYQGKILADALAKKATIASSRVIAQDVSIAIPNYSTSEPWAALVIGVSWASETPNVSIQLISAIYADNFLSIINISAGGQYQGKIYQEFNGTINYRFFNNDGGKVWVIGL